ncbi:MAG: tetratricopeptide repeat protein [Burkholderiales bacterium]|nr:tetratricopeptide repeat protein [Burkholderiales bacterium]
MRAWLALGLLCSTMAALASPESEALKREGLQSLAAGRFDAAMERFAAAARSDPADLQALYLQGVAANRLGQFSAAEPALRRAEAGGYRDPELDFELGWAALAGGRAQECLDRLERFEAAAPGRGQVSEFRGRCHLARRELDKAEALFRQALSRDPRLAPTVNLSLAALEQERGKPAAAQEHLEVAVSADAPTGRALRDLAGPPEPPEQPDKPLRLSASIAGGHNSNVIALGKTIPLPTDISNKSAYFARTAFGASYSRQMTQSTGVTAGYALLLDRYENLSSSNLNDHYLYADMFHQATERMALSMRANAEYTGLGGDRFRNLWGLRPALSYRFLRNSVTEFSYTYASSDYKVQTAPVYDRDGPARNLAAVHSFRLGGTDWSGAVGLSRNRNDTQGSDFQSHSWGASGTMRYTFANRVVLAFGASALRDNYDNPNSLAGSGFAYERKDRQRTLSTQVSGPLAPSLRWFAQAQHLRNKSNIAFYEYDQTVFSAGLAADF